MDERIVVEAMHTGERRPYPDYIWHKDLILMYDDGTWERIFKHYLSEGSNVKRVNIANLVGKTRSQAIAQLEELYYSDIIKGKFLDER